MSRVLLLLLLLQGQIFSLSRNASAVHPFGSLVFDSHEECCKVGLSCCYAAHVGMAVAIMETDKPEFKPTATVAIGDPGAHSSTNAECAGEFAEYAELRR